MTESTRCGYVAIVGRPNVGKSTLLNRLLGKKISITSRKPQTTRNQILGIKTEQQLQIVYVDTPGLHQTSGSAINRHMNRAARQALQDINVIVFVVEPAWSDQDQWVLDQLKETTALVFLAINKIDRVKNRETLLPYIEKMTERYPFKAIIPLSAKTGDQIPNLQQVVSACLPEEPFYFPPDQVTDRSEQFMVTETIREKLMRLLGQELPYALAVSLVAFKKEPKTVRISAVIWVETSGQKGIVIGKGGERLKKIGTQARLDLEKFFSNKVYVQLWVKVKSGWTDSEKLLKEIGFEG